MFDQEAYAKHQSKIMKMQNYNCMGYEMTWIGSLKGKARIGYEDIFKTCFN